MIENNALWKKIQFEMSGESKNQLMKLGLLLFWEK